jgi:hypothetical protein
MNLIKLESNRMKPRNKDRMSRTKLRNLMINSRKSEKRLIKSMNRETKTEKSTSSNFLNLNWKLMRSITVKELEEINRD